MTTSERAYVWTWLPGSVEPVLAGAAEQHNERVSFFYSQSYLGRDDALSLYTPELPLRRGWIDPKPGLNIAGALRDGSPDGCGRGVIDNHLGNGLDSLNEIQYMLESGSNRFGALDFQSSPTEYVPRFENATLGELQEAAERLQDGMELSPALQAALLHGTMIGGARPKAALIGEDGVQYIAKFSARSDVAFSVVGAEATAMELARRAGLNVAATRVITLLGRRVLLVERFDRVGFERRHVVSGLTMVEQDEMMARYATYPDMMDVLRAHFSDDGEELFSRIAFNIAVSNSDDHARNHAAFWDGHSLSLTPAYDIAPGNRSGETASQAMAYGRDGSRESNLAKLAQHAHEYGLSRKQACGIIDRIEDTIRSDFNDAADLAELSSKDRQTMFGHQFLNPGSLHDYRPVQVGFSGAQPRRPSGRPDGGRFSEHTRPEADTQLPPL